MKYYCWCPEYEPDSAGTEVEADTVEHAAEIYADEADEKQLFEETETQIIVIVEAEAGAFFECTVDLGAF